MSGLCIFVFCVQWFEVRCSWLCCWYWWKKLQSIHNVAENTNVIVYGLTRPGLNPTIYNGIHYIKTWFNLWSMKTTKNDWAILERSEYFCATHSSPTIQQLFPHLATPQWIQLSEMFSILDHIFLYHPPQPLAVIFASFCTRRVIIYRTSYTDPPFRTLLNGSFNWLRQVGFFFTGI